MTETLRLALLGGCHVTRGERPIRGFVSRKTEALLCYLAVTGRPQRRATLATLLWGDLPDERANLSLRQSLHNLRQLLPDHLHITRSEVAFRRDSPYWLDVEVFASALDGLALDSPETPPPPLAAAVDLYQGAFLAGFAVRDAPDFADWAVIEGERLHQLALRGLRVLAARCAERGDYGAALRYGGRLLALEPWQEDGHRQLMTVLALTGRRVDALRQYEVCRRTLAEELGIAPSPETAALAESIRQGTLAGTPASADTRPALRRIAHLSAPLTPLIGREREAAAVRDLLRCPGVRLVTLSGTGGVGKTRLALAVAQGLESAFADGAAFVSLAAVRDPALVAETLAAVLDVAERGDRPPTEKLKAYLGDRELLLVVDNLEQVLAAAPLLTELLAACPRLTVLATSRATLRLRGEHVYTVPPLACPPPGTVVSPDALRQYPAVALFAERAGAAQPSFALSAANVGDIAEICARLGGLPLAIELAAARTALLPPGALLKRLGQRLAVLTGGARDQPERQRTLRATIAWSYDLLAAEDRALFRSLAVFTGGATLAAIAAICDPDGERDLLGDLAALMDRSLLRQADSGDAARLDDGEPRVTMLETLHEYATERLEASGEAAELRRRHAAYYLTLAEAAEPELSGAAQATWLARLEAEHDNLRAALAWGLQGDPAVGLRLAAALWLFWWTHGHLTEGRGWLERLLARNPAPTPTRARGLLGAGVLATQQGDWHAARAQMEAGLALSRAQGDDALTAGLLRELGMLLSYFSEYRAARPVLEEALAISRSLDDPHGLEASLLNLARLVRSLGEYADARALLGEALAVARARRSARSVAVIRAVRGDIARYEGDLAGAAIEYEAGLVAAREVGHPTYVAWTIAGLGQVALWRGETARATALLEEGLGLYRELGNAHSIGFVLHMLGLVAWRAGDPDRASGLLCEALALRWQLGGRAGVADSLEGLALVATNWGQPGRAVRLLATAATVRTAVGAVAPPIERATVDEANRAVRAALGERAYAAAWAAGAALPLEQMVRETLAAASERTVPPAPSLR